jgi:FAD-dependent oxidoreductase family protein
MTSECTQVLVVGGGLGGIAAGLSAAERGHLVTIVETGGWLGGQLTSQGVPADEHEWIEDFGATATYRRVRDGIRDYYRHHYPLTARARNQGRLRPGASLVSAISCEPRAALAVLYDMLAPHRAAGRVKIRLRTRAVAIAWNGDTCAGVEFEDDDGKRFEITARFVIDATELGDLLAIGGIEHVAGSEGSGATGELHAASIEPEPSAMQAVTWVAALSYEPGKDNTIDRPAEYDAWRSYQAPYEDRPHLSWRAMKKHRFSLFGDDPDGPFSIWKFRRALYAGNFAGASGIRDVTLLNAPQNDYWGSPIFGGSDEENRVALEHARQLTLSAIYWMQTEAPRPDGGTGYPGLEPRPDVFGTADGLAQTPYVRESRRIIAETTVLEQHIGVDARPGAIGAEHFPDSVGIGAYKLDLHSRTNGVAEVNAAAWPFQIPLGALLPVRVENVLPACKNIGTTHVTNGCMRLHPVEWNIGESVGTLAAYCIENDIVPREVRSRGDFLEEFQRLLERRGIELQWPLAAEARSYYKAHVEDPSWDWGEDPELAPEIST